jgi:DNA-binding response OmpR family regulator
MNDIIIIVDDNTENLKVLGNVLKENGYKIAVAKSGADALILLENIKPSLILLDVMMPEMDGYMVCKQLKKNENWSEIPVIFLTARTETEDIVKGFEAGGVDYISKPFNITELLARVKTHKDLFDSKEIIKRQTEQLKIYSNFLETRVSTQKHDIQKLKEMLDFKSTIHGNI